ncbi:DUF427 domain-containing protein [Curtobacterium sp. MCPF17_002]|uniref:DUF427 domain-containing protein n=1 Tax=Curtobacterium sp. MCPF17_002 TaxID=2175645 RepID=UPI001C64768A|nr:DUF427 domain-containing protein [Curtobacterium sp. MCPF17_002]WIB79180.1 DUF427 domain-containing protein [Curtobacterium sp. MCPF17_002]
MSHPVESATLRRRHPPLPDHVTWEPSSRRVRAVTDEVTVVDTVAPILVWEAAQKVPEYGIPVADVRTDLLRVAEDAPAPGRSWRPVRPARRWYDLVLPGRVVRHVAWAWDDDGLDGYLGVTWTPGVLDAWYEEDEPVITHPRDPHNRVDALRSSRHVVVRDGDRVLADTTAPVAVYETGLPTRWYVPRADVRFDTLVATDTVSECPYKGHATEYWAVRRADGSVEDVAWSYPAPFAAVAAVRGLVAFWGERVAVEVDGVAEVAVADLRV